MVEYDKSVVNKPLKRVKNHQKKSQFSFGILTLMLLIIFGLLLSKISSTLALYWITGIVLGFTLQKSRFCFAASIRDPYLTGITSLTKAVLVAFAITTVGFTAIKYGAFINGLPIPGQDHITPINIAMAIGAFIFGIGMVISGGCASGTLMRVGEGFLLQLITLIFFIIGSLWGAHDYGWWYNKFIHKGKAIFMADIFGWFGALVIQLLFIAILYIIADKWGNKEHGL